MHPRSRARNALVGLAVLWSLGACAPESPQAHLAAARTALAKKDFDTASVHLKAALQGQPQMAEARLLLARSALDFGNFGEAETNIRKLEDMGQPVVVLAPLQARLLLAQGKSKMVIDRFAAKRLPEPDADAALRTIVASAQSIQKQNAEAMANIDAVLAIDAKHLEARMLRARILLAARDFAGARQLTESITQDHPASAEARFLHALSLAHGDAKPQEVIADFRKSLELDPRLPQAHAALIETYVQIKDFKEARNQLAVYARLHPRDLRTRLLAANIALKEGDLKLARERAQDLMKIAPTHPAALAMAGQIAFLNGDWRQAETHLAKSLNSDPDNTLVRTMLVRALLRLGESDKALVALRSRIGTGEPQAELLALSGYANMMRGDLVKAEADWAASAKLSRDQTAARYSLAMLHLSSGKSSQGFAELQEMADQEQDTHVALLALINHRMRLGEVDKALEEIARLDAKQAKSPLAPFLRGQIELGRRKLPEARAAFEEALKRDPEHFQSIESLASIEASGSGGLDKARARFESLLRINPKHVPARLALVRIKAHTGASSAEVGEMLTALVKDAPDSVDAHVHLVGYYVEQRDFKKAIAAGQAGATQSGRAPAMLDALGRAQLLGGELNQALSTFGRWANEQPQEPKPLLRVAEVMAARKDYDGAAEALRKVLTLQPHHVEAQKDLVRLALARNNFEAAMGQARTMQGWRPQRAVGLVLEGDIEAARAQWAGARRAYLKAQELEPRESSIAVKLHQVGVMGGQAAEADKQAEQWLARNSQSFEFTVYLGNDAVQRNLLPQAERLFERAMELDPDAGSVVNNLAWIRVKLKRPNALLLAQQSVARYPNNATALDTLASAFAQAGQMGEALKAQQQACKLAPKVVAHRLQLAELLIQAKRHAEARQALQDARSLDANDAEKQEAERLAGLLRT